MKTGDRVKLSEIAVNNVHDGWRENRRKRRGVLVRFNRLGNPMVQWDHYKRGQLQEWEKDAIVSVGGLVSETEDRWRTALADAICHPRGVIPNSAGGLLVPKDLVEAEARYVSKTEQQNRKAHENSF